MVSRLNGRISSSALIFTVLLLVTCMQSFSQRAVATRQRLLAYYYMERDPAYSSRNIPFAKRQITHVIHAFLYVNNNGTLEIDGKLLEPELIFRAHAGAAKVLISIGGGGNRMEAQAENFRRVSADTSYRIAFAKRVKDFVVQNGYDGVDIDWEVPEQADTENCTALMKALRAELPDGRFLLSVTVPSDPTSWGKGFDIPALNPIVDFINVMTYDRTNCSGALAGHNSSMSILIESMELFTKNEQWKADPRKLNFGTAFYGYEFDGVRAFGERYAKDGCKDLSYAKIETILAKPAHGGWRLMRDSEVGGAPYLLREDPDALISYDDEASTRSKVEVVIRDRHMGGIFAWRLGRDFDSVTGKQPLLDALMNTYAKFANK